MWDSQQTSSRPGTTSGAQKNCFVLLKTLTRHNFMLGRPIEAILVGISDIFLRSSAVIFVCTSTLLIFPSGWFQLFGFFNKIMTPDILDCLVSFSINEDETECVGLPKSAIDNAKDSCKFSGTSILVLMCLKILHLNSEFPEMNFLIRRVWGVSDKFDPDSSRIVTDSSTLTVPRSGSTVSPVIVNRSSSNSQNLGVSEPFCHLLLQPQC
ncbi:hypothetical protein M9H77_31358 [Catharanthus roseus]|uniref:Uncharacterized protein n=1 Tax=Catharanthus roseus TaxID=4058 RepID=A0ACC0A0U0_CATRO|nr:hypothetical protein M9H77_31358 [Catharanthus roseus]